MLDVHGASGCHALLIEFFEVPPDADEAFLADWERERSGATLYRAIRDDTPVRFVSVAPGDSHELIHEDGDVDGDGGIIRIDVFDDRGLVAWREVREVFATRRGYLGTRLYRGVDGGFVSIARWSSPLVVQRADPSHPPLYQRRATGAP
jgi:hypothetical protein